VFKAAGSVAKHENTAHFINAASNVAGTAISAKAQVKQSKYDMQAQQMQMQQMQQMPGQYRRDLEDDDLSQFSRRSGGKGLAQLPCP
jgi:DNA primase